MDKKKNTPAQRFAECLGRLSPDQTTELLTHLTNTNVYRPQLRIRIPDGQVLESALFEALLSYTEGLPPVIIVNGDYLLHGRETVESAALGGVKHTTKVTVIHLTGDADEIGRAFNAQDCDWPELLEAGRRCYVEASPPNRSYIAWLKHEIAKRRVQ